jgi:hypothetical protein
VVLDSIKVLADGDSSISGSGEWHFALQINGITYRFYRAFDEGTYKLGFVFNVDWTSRVDIAFSGYEGDDGLFTGGDDELGRWETSMPLPPRQLFFRRILTSPIIAKDGTSYQLTFSYG